MHWKVTVPQAGAPEVGSRPLSLPWLFVEHMVDNVCQVSGWFGWWDPILCLDWSLSFQSFWYEGGTSGLFCVVLSSPRQEHLLPPVICVNNHFLMRQAHRPTPALILTW